MKYIAAGAIRKRLGRSKSTNFRGRFKMTPRRAICNLLCLISSLAALMVKRRANCAMLGSETVDFPDKNVMELVCSAGSDTAAVYTRAVGHQPAASSISHPRAGRCSTDQSVTAAGPVANSFLIVRYSGKLGPNT